jgi:hypothetical protein
MVGHHLFLKDMQLYIFNIVDNTINIVNCDHIDDKFLTAFGRYVTNHRC